MQPTPVGARDQPVVAEYVDIPHTMTRRTIARRLTEAKQQVPHFYLKVSCCIDPLLAFRERINAAAPAKVSVNDMVVRAAALACVAVPEATLSWGEDATRRHRAVDVAVAVATPRGLVTPIIRDAHVKSLHDISTETKELVARARLGRLKKEEYQGGHISISNLGMFGIEEFSAIVNPPQSCILAVGAGLQQAVVRDGSLVIATMMTVTASVDHRAVDGATAAQFLSTFRRLVEAPSNMAD